MAETFRLRAEDLPVQLEWSGITLIAPGLYGEGTWTGPRERGEVRDFTRDAARLEEGLLEAGLADRGTLEIAAATPEIPAGAGRGAGALAADEIELQVPAGEAEALFLLYEDEAGIVSFHYPVPEGSASPGAATAAPLPTRSFGAARLDRFRFTLRDGRAPAGGEPGRGLFAAAGRKLIKVIALVLRGPVGSLIHGAAERWEASFRAFQGLRAAGTLEQLLDPAPSPFEGWREGGAPAGRRALLFLHGTTSSTANAFAGLGRFPAEYERLSRAYAGRVLGFEHHTLARSVAENVAAFYAALPPGEHAFDVITHSRGGLLARALTGLPDGAIASALGQPWSRPPGTRIAIGRLVFVATPNGGTDLALPENLAGTIDRLGNYISFLPDSALVIALPAVLALAAAVAQRGLEVLPGLADQAPGSPLLASLGPGPGEAERYYALQADYRPREGLLAALFDRGVDRAFGDRHNDVVVPTDAVASNDAFRLPPTRIHAFGEADGVHHTNFFCAEQTVAKLLEFLAVPAA